MQRRSSRRKLDGVLLLDKPIGVTSNSALQTAKRLLNAAKAGHTGTLDPMASGLLPLTFGEATKFSQMLLDADKTYEATITLGVETDTGDAEGKPVANLPVSVTYDEIVSAMTGFVGEIEQVPPMYSALKRDGKPLYEYARAGIEVELAPRRVKIYTLELLEVDVNSFSVRVKCSKGTYIRTLAIDLGRVLGCGAHLSALRRTVIGAFRIESAVSLARLDEVEASGRSDLLAPVDFMLQHLPSLALDPLQAGAILQGRCLSAMHGTSGLVRLYGNERFLGLGEFRSNGELSPKRLIATGNSSELA